MPQLRQMVLELFSGHETRTGFRRRNAQLSEMGALSVKVEGINVRLHPTDREVYAEMKVLLDQPICRSVRTLQGITGEAGDVPLSAALEFALEGVGDLIEAPVSARHTIVRFSASYWSTLQRTWDGWSDNYARAGVPSPVAAYGACGMSSSLGNELGILLGLPVLSESGLHPTCIQHAEVLPSGTMDFVEVFVYTDKDCVNDIDMAVERIARTHRECATSPVGGGLGGDGATVPVITTVAVPLLRVWFMADAGARLDRALVGGQTILTFKFGDLPGLSESLTYNSYPLIAYSGPDDGPTMCSYYKKLERDKRSQRRHPIMFNGIVYGFEDGWGADGKGRRDQEGGVNAAGSGCEGWRNECCTVCTATLRSNVPACHVCTVRVVEDRRNIDGTIEIGMATGGVLRHHFGRCGELANMLKKERDLSQILPYVQKHVADDNEWDVVVHVGRSFGKADNELTSPVFEPVQKARAIVRWINSDGYAYGPIKKLRNRLLELKESTNTADFVVEAEKQILAVEQLLRNEGKTAKKDVLPGLEALLEELVNNLTHAGQHLASAHVELGAAFDLAVASFLTPASGSAQLGVRNVSPVDALLLIPQARARAHRILLRLQDVKNKEGMEQPVVPADIDAAIGELIDGDGKSENGLYTMAAGVATKDHCRDA